MAAIVIAPLSEARAAESAEWQVSDREYRLVLIVPETGQDQAGNEREVFFVDFKETGRKMDSMDGVSSFPFVKSINRAIGRKPDLPDVNTFRLQARKGGAPILFSLDYRLGGPPPPSGERRLVPNGRRGEKNPAPEEKLRRLGFLSFQPIPGETEYHLYFNLGNAENLREKTDKNIRPWWIEAVTDPCFELDKDNDGKPDLCLFWAKESPAKFWKIVSQPGQPGKKCLEISHPAGGTVRSRPELYQFDRRSAGRRVILYQQVQADNELSGQAIGLPLPNFKPPPDNSINWYFGKIPAGGWNELCVEGRVSPLFDRLAPEKRSEFWYTGPCRIRETHVQFPPENPDMNRMAIDTDITYQTDEIELFWKSRDSEIFFDVPVVLEGKRGKRLEIRADRVENWREGFVLEAKLISEKSGIVGKVEGEAECGKQWRGTMRLADLAPGKYLLRFEAKSRRKISETVATLEKDIRIITSPFE